MFFRYGNPLPSAEPLALLGGSLILDAGEADQSFLLRCQDRFVTYAWLLGLRPILLAENESAARRIVDALALLRGDCARIARVCGIPALRCPAEPLILGCDPLEARVFPLLPFPALAPQAVFHLNQISPSAARLVEGIADILEDQGVDHALDRQVLHADAVRALKLHDKRSAIALAQTCPTPAPAMLATAMIEPEELAGLQSWKALRDLYCSRTGEAPAEALVVKSALDSAGNVSATLARETFEEGRARVLNAYADAAGIDVDTAISSMRGDIARSRLDPAAYDTPRLAKFEELRRERRAGVSLLVQRCVPRARSTWQKPASLGLTFHVTDAVVRLLAVNAQTYHDAERRHFRGALLDRRIETAFAESPFATEMHNLALHFAGAGYRGPIGFDALRDVDDSYILIHDCNPRLSAVFPALAMRGALHPKPNSLLSLGYRGEVQVPDLPAALAALAAAGLLYGAGRTSGLLLLPNMAGPQRCDLLLIDSTPRLLDSAASVLEAAGVRAGISSIIPGMPVE